MDELSLRSLAKVNLTFDVVGRRPTDGYHYVKTVMVPIELADGISMHRTLPITVTCEPDIAGPEAQNLAYRAAVLLKERTGYPGGVAIQVQKVIPVAGGLAGGSGNAAAVLRGLNELWGTGLADADLVEIAIQLGSDVPFFLFQRPARVEGIGEQITVLPSASALWLVLATPDVAKSTGTVYRLFDQLDCVDHPDTEAMERALAAGDVRAMARALGNVFEPVMLPRHPEIAALKRAMLDAGALGALMSGAGPTVFGLVDSAEAGKALAERVRPLATRVFVTEVARPADAK